MCPRLFPFNQPGMKLIFKFRSNFDGLSLEIQDCAANVSDSSSTFKLNIPVCTSVNLQNPPCSEPKGTF